MVRGQTPRRTTGRGLAPWQLELASRLLLRDLCAEVSASDLAQRCGLSRSHFTKAFAVSTGAPPHRWVVRHRIRRAAEMLEGTRERISVIAASCGFSDQSHLTRVFHAALGASPAAWRRQRHAGVVVENAAGKRGGPSFVALA
jgi:AraC-like DNA-binding protein